MTPDLFNDPWRLPLVDADVVYHPAPDLGISADELHAQLKDELVWEQHFVRIEGKTIPQPRLSSWYGEVVHTYSTLAHALKPYPFTPLLEKLKNRIEAICNARFNSMLANLYRDGSDSIGWHSDKEPELGIDPVIASLSFGAERRFDLRRKDNHAKTARIVLQHGSLLIMGGGTQQYWQHGIARTTGVVGERINLTFRLTTPGRRTSKPYLQQPSS
ncbi:alpha-ketoglutarate-dependent dioxygenase AlkB family protein [Rhizobium sp. G187]|uniref:alpha-ketoglutarate-dependent dioxygenase AlkB family protein n=1 Tax=Rhizobium sp. G187 TaxID=3451352 RepID=UPI003EE4F00E